MKNENEHTENTNQILKPEFLAKAEACEYILTYLLQA